MRHRSHEPAPRRPASMLAVVPIPTLLAACAALLVLVATVLLTRWRLQSDLHAVLAEREGRAVAALFEGRLATLRAEGQDDPLLAAVEVAALPQMLSLRAITLHDAAGRSATRLLGSETVPAFPDDVPASASAATGVLSRFVGAEGSSPARLRVHLPLRDDLVGGFSGRVAMELDASGLEAEYHRMDAAMRRQGLWTLAVSGTALSGAFLAAFVGLVRANRLLAERTRLLEATHRELAFADRAGAVGAVAAHLVHGLRGPLAGLQVFVSGLGRGSPDAVEVLEAADAARRMRTLVDEVVRLLRQDPGLSGFEVPVAELLPMLESRLPRSAAARGVRLRWDAGPRRTIGSREAGLALLILENLVANGAAASPDHGSVHVAASDGDDGSVCFRVSDPGPGLPEAVLASLFQPACPRSGAGAGLGIGLAITRRLAAAVDAELALESTGPRGTVFRLRLPRRDAGTRGGPEPWDADVPEPAPASGSRT